MSLWSQYFPLSPSLTEANLPSQADKIVVVPGGASGVGFELASILYYAGAKIKEGQPQTAPKVVAAAKPPGTLEFLQLDLADLKTVAPAAQEFLQKETKLDVLWNNDGVGATFKGEKSVQGLPIRFGTNCLGPFLFTHLLQPALDRADGARVVWADSTVVDSSAPKGGMIVSDWETPKNDGIHNYTSSKTGNWFLASEFSRREKMRTEGKTLHVAANPGNLHAAVWREWSRLFVAVLSAIFLHNARFGAYTFLWVGLSPALGVDDSGLYVVPWGRKHSQPRADILGSLKSTREPGGTGLAEEFYEWCEKQVADFR